MTAEETKAKMQIVKSQTPTQTVSSRASASSSSKTASKAAESTSTAIELVENFYINNKRKSNVKIQVKLNASGIYLRRETEQRNNINEQLIRIEDIIGSRFGARLKKRARGGLSSCKRKQDNENENEIENDENISKDTSAYLYIYAYIKTEKATAARHRTVRILRFRSYDRFEENLKLAERWHCAIRVNRSSTCAVPGMMEQSKPLLILLNPKSGSGKSRELFQKQVAPVLKEADVHYELQITTHANYAHELVRYRKDLEHCYSGIVIASGDGLFYEVLNGLMARADWYNVCRKLPIGIVPCGSGNGLAASIAYLYNEAYDQKPVMHAALTCVSGHTAPMDIVRIELAKTGDKPVYSFLSFGWGLIADIDIESERLRSIGAQRFTLWSIHRLISLRTHRGKLSYMPYKPPQKQQKIASTPTKSPEPNNGFYDAVAGVADDVAEAAEVEDHFADAISLDGMSFRPHVESWHSAASRRTAYYSIAGQSVCSKRSLTGSILSKLEQLNADYESRFPEPPRSNLPPLNMPLPDDTWISEEGEFIMVHAAYTTHLATDCFFAPASRLNDGIIYLVIIRAGCSRSQLLQFLLGLSSGTHIPTTPNEHIQVIPVNAFRIEPSEDVGIMAIDGERVDYGAIQAEILPGVINVMVPNGKPIET